MMIDMLTTHIGRVDLNLLPALVALLEERQVSRAATRVGLSQPAMSRALQRLRRLLDDQLLIRDPNGLRLTAHAEDLYRQLTTVVPLLENMFAPTEFDPRSAAGPVNIAGTDYAVHTYGAAICRQIARQAPEVPVRFHAWRTDDVTDQIRRGAVDLGLSGGKLPVDFNAVELLTERFVCLVAADHPLAGSSNLTLAGYLSFNHVIVDVADGHQPDIDIPLAALGHRRRPAVTIAYHTAAPLLLPGTQLIATLPARFLGAGTDVSGLCALDAPHEIATMSYRMIWNPAFDNDRRHRWLRTVVQTAMT